jgi:hypothetical protein
MESENELEEEEEGGVGISFLIQLCWKKISSWFNQ